MRDKLRVSSYPSVHGTGSGGQKPLPAPGAVAQRADAIPPVSRSVPVQRYAGNGVQSVVDQVAEETPVALVYNGQPQVVMMATPADIEDLAVGFSVTERIVEHADEIQSVRVSPVKDGLQAEVSVSGERLATLLRRQRNLSGRTGCGVCGVESIEQVVRTPRAITSDCRVSAAAMHEALRSLNERQTLNRIVGSVHGAAWISAGKRIDVVREDVGRHNALDKSIGALLRASVDPGTGYFIITSRASYEMVLKAATVGVSVLVAVSAPTGLAIDLAGRCGMTLVGFARQVAHELSHVVYTHPERITA